MRATVLAEGTERTLAVIFDTGDEVVAGLERLATDHGLTASRLSAIGAFSDVVLGFFEWDTKEYREISITEQVEVVTLLGDIAIAEGRPKVHAHAVMGLPDGTTRGGHLLRGTVRPTLEVILEESPAHLERVSDPITGLPLVRIRETDAI